MRLLFVVLAALSVGSPAAAETLDLGGSWRLRYENAAQDNVGDDSDALTLRASGYARWEPTSWLSLFGELETVAALGSHDDGEGLPQGRPVVPDPAFVGLNQAFLELRPQEQLTLRFGRQNIIHGNERFVGTVAFRQNHQSYDGLRGMITAPQGITLDVGYIVGVNRPVGLRGQDRNIDSESLLLRAEWPTPIGTLTAFRYDLELGQEFGAEIVTGGDSVTYGGTFEGSYGNDTIGVTYSASLAQQDNHRTRETVPYGQAGAALRIASITFSYGYERLGAGTEAFQTPLGTNHAFQGDADLFLVTPVGGLADQSISAAWRLGDLGVLRGVSVKARAHRFDPTLNAQRYGEELDLSVGAQWRGTKLSLARGDYRADGFGTDTTRWWLTAGRSF